MPRYPDLSEFTRTMINGNPIMVYAWKWVSNDYESDRKFVVVEEGVDLGQGPISLDEIQLRRQLKLNANNCYSEATPMLICEEVL